MVAGAGGGAGCRRAATVSGARSAERRALSLAGRAQLRGPRSARGARAHLSGTPTHPHRARLRLLHVIVTVPPPEPRPLASDPLWYKDAIFYELRVGAFQDSDGD